MTLILSPRAMGGAVGGGAAVVAYLQLVARQPGQISVLAIFDRVSVRAPVHELSNVTLIAGRNAGAGFCVACPPTGAAIAAGLAPSATANQYRLVTPDAGCCARFASPNACRDFAEGVHLAGRAAAHVAVGQEQGSFFANDLVVSLAAFGALGGTSPGAAPRPTAGHHAGDAGALTVGRGDVGAGAEDVLRAVAVGDVVLVARRDAETALILG